MGERSRGIESRGWPERCREWEAGLRGLVHSRRREALASRAGESVSLVGAVGQVSWAWSLADECYPCLRFTRYPCLRSGTGELGRRGSRLCVVWLTRDARGPGVTRKRVLLAAAVGQMN